MRTTFLFILPCLVTLSGCGGGLDYIALHPVYRMKVINTFKIAAVSYETPAVEMKPVSARESSANGNNNDVNSWHEVSQKLKLPDFTAAITRQLVRGMSARAGLRNLSVDRESLPLPAKKNLVFYKERYSDSNYVLEVKINSLAIKKSEVPGKSHELVLHAQGQMIRQYYSKVIWKYHCLVSAEKNPVYAWEAGDFFTDEGKQIKRAVSHAIVNCAKSMVDDYMMDNIRK